MFPVIANLSCLKPVAMTTAKIWALFQIWIDRNGSMTEPFSSSGKEYVDKYNKNTFFLLFVYILVHVLCMTGHIYKLCQLK